jgi:hypothetical protein
VKRRSLLALVPLALLACEVRRQVAAPEDRLELQQAQGYMASVPTALPARYSRIVASDSAAAAPFTPGGATANMVIRTASASIKVDSLEPAIAALRDLAARVKVPAARFDEAMTGLKPIGTLESSKVQADDVGEEYVDVTARMENARRLERRLIDLLATRTGKLKDVLDVEQSLARVREEIERYQGRLRYLQAHTALSTLTVYVHEPVPVVGSAGSSVMGEAFKQAWRNFVMFLAVFVQALGVIVPLGALAGAVWLVVRAKGRASSRAEA